MPTPPPSDNSHLEAQILILQQTLNHFKEQHKEDIKQLKLQVIKMQRKIDDFENQLFSIQQRLTRKNHTRAKKVAKFTA